ncbi:MAG TPA: type II secretion system F family protein, partial [Burkholderiaceae bacterium]
MAEYRYLALSDAGAEVRGQLEAASEDDALAQLRQQGLMPLEAHAGGTSPGATSALGWLLPRAWMPARATDVGMLLRQVALMLRAGHTVVQALRACTQLTDKRRMRTAIAGMGDTIERGASLSAAMREQPMFSPFMARMTEAGEVSGEVDAILDRLADDLQRKTELRRQLITSMTYPVIVVLGAAGVVTFLVTTVIPRFANFLQARGGQLPWAAGMLMEITAFMQRWGPTLLGALLLAVFAFVAARTVPRSRVLVDRALLRLPVVAQPMITGGMAQICWTLGLLLRSGLPVLDAVRASAQACRNAALADALERAAADVLGGSNLAAALDKPGMPYLMRHMVNVGQQAGELDTVLETLGNYYRHELDLRIRLISALIEPALIVTVGGIVGFVYYAFFQAVFAVSTGG